MPQCPRLLRFARRLTSRNSEAEDLLQEALLKAWRNFHQFKAGTNVGAWLFRILMNVHYAGHRAADLFSMAEPPNTPDLSCAEEGPDTLVVREALDRLPEEQRRVLYLVVVEGFTCRETAEILMIPAGTVMSRLSRARDAMRSYLTQDGRNAHREKRNELSAGHRA